MILWLLIVFIVFAIALPIIGLLLRTQGYLETELPFYLISGIILMIFSTATFIGGVQYKTGMNVTKVSATQTTSNAIYTDYNQYNIREILGSIIFLLALTMILAGYNFDKMRRSKKIEQEGESGY